MPWTGPPKTTGKLYDLSVTGYFIAWSVTDNCPFYVLLENTDEPFLCVFSSPEKLHAHL